MQNVNILNKIDVYRLNTMCDGDSDGGAHLIIEIFYVKYNIRSRT